MADSIRKEYDAFAENIDGLQRQIGGTTDRAVRDAGSANDVRDFFKQKSAVARFISVAQMTPGSNVVAGNPASFTAYAKTLIDLPDSKEKTDKLQSLGLGLNQLKAMKDESFASLVRVDPNLGNQQTLDGFIASFDSLLQGPQKAAFVAELGAFLASKNSPSLKTSADPDKVLADVRKNLVTAHTEILHRQVEAAGAWGQAVWFNNYRQVNVGVNAQSWGNFLIASMDYTEMYDAKTGAELTFEQRVSRAPLDVTKMKGAMISNDVQIELMAEEGYTGAIRGAQYAVNKAAAGLLMDFALSKNIPGLTANNAAAFERWLANSAALPAPAKKAFLEEASAFAAAKGSPINLAQTFQSLVEQEQAISLLTRFYEVQNPTLSSGDRAAVEAWCRTQGNLGEAKLNDFLTEVARFAETHKSEVPLSPTLLRTLDFKPFTEANVGQPVAGHAALQEGLDAAREVWGMVKNAQQDLSAARGKEVARVLEDNDVGGTDWEPPTKAKGDYAIDLVLP